MAARSKVIVARDEPFDEFAALDEDDESTRRIHPHHHREEIHALIERERDDFISLERCEATRHKSLDHSHQRFIPTTKPEDARKRLVAILW